MDKKIKLSANIIMSCPSCGRTLIIANPLRQEGLLGGHEIKQRCGECKKMIIVYLDILIKMWQIQ